MALLSESNYRFFEIHQLDGGDMKKIVISVALAPFLIFFIFLHQHRLARLDATVASMESDISDIASQNSDMEDRIDNLE